MSLFKGRQPYQLTVSWTLLVLLTLVVLHPRVNLNSFQGSAHQMGLSSLPTAMEFSDVGHHGHSHDSTDSDKGHNPFDHSHETQHPPYELRHKQLTPLAAWSNTYRPIAVLAHNGRLDRPPRPPLTA